MARGGHARARTGRHEVGKLVVDVGMLVGKLCDEFVSKHTKDEKIITLLETIRKSKVTKARLLHYFSKTKKQLELERESPRKEVRTRFRHGVDGTTITVV